MNLAIRGIDAQTSATTADTLPPRPAPGPQGRLRPRQPALQRQRLARRRCSRTTSAGSTACRPPATPTTPGCSTSSTTSRRRASPASCSPTARMSSNQSARARSARHHRGRPGRLHGRAARASSSTRHQIPVCLWFLRARTERNGRFRDRRGETLFIDARKLGRMENRTARARRATSRRSPAPTTPGAASRRDAHTPTCPASACVGHPGGESRVGHYVAHAGPLRRGRGRRGRRRADRGEGESAPQPS